MTWKEHIAPIGSIHELTNGETLIAWVRPWIGGQYKCTVYPSPAVSIGHLAPTVEEGKAWCERTLAGLGIVVTKESEIA